MKSPRWTLRAAAAAGVILAVGWPASIAAAHAALKSSNPKDGAVLSAAPAELRLTFNEKLQDDFTTVRLRGL
ncbi:copper resistance CopC family protein [Actinoplanes sp. ATCC 53533]|uniref:copper resistance CopC family protein n=1 Tax=Actinoplanes sp. ATCC 53533 TaxID=1288362 RepID=UPI0018F51D4D|nr:copper resistance CopC family protein [Actinoplanes sp. ATCC 53533]